MPDNPFKPPSAEVADPVSTAPARPLAVRLACQFLLVSLVLSLATLLPGVRTSTPDEQEIPLIFSVIVFGVLVGLSLFLIAKSYEGRNWARWTNLALLTLGWWLVAQDLASGTHLSSIEVTLDVVVVLMELTATWLLFTGIGSYWFKEMSRASRGA